MIKMINNKGQLGNLYQYVLLFVMVGIILAVSFIVLGNFSTASYASTTATNESMAGNGTHTAANIPVKSFGVVYNSTDNSTFTNFTTSGNNITFLTNGTGAETFLVTYTYYVNTTASTSTFSTIDSLTPISTNWMPVLVIIAVTSIILAMVIGAFGAYRARK